MEVKDCIREGNLHCVCCLRGGVLSAEEKEDLVDAIIAKSQISPKVKKEIDEIAPMER